jgi:hypothetical protein
LQLQRFRREHEVDLQVSKLGSANRPAELAKIRRRVDERLGFGHLQSVMHGRIVVEQLRNAGESDFDQVTAGTAAASDTAPIAEVNSLLIL